MSKKTIEEIVADLYDAGSRHFTEYDNQETVLAEAIAALNDLRREDMKFVIGEKAAPDTKKRTAITKNGHYEYEPAYSLRASVINQKLDEQTARMNQRLNQSGGSSDDHR